MYLISGQADAKPETDREKLVKVISSKIWDWEDSSQLYREFAEEIVALCEAHFLQVEKPIQPLNSKDETGGA